MPGPLQTTNTKTSLRTRAGRKAEIREEVWKLRGEVVRYNLAFVVPSYLYADNGRVLGYDNAHGFHERHFMGVAERVPYTTYDDLLSRFIQETARLREEL